MVSPINIVEGIRSDRNGQETKEPVSLIQHLAHLQEILVTIVNEDLTAPQPGIFYERYDKFRNLYRNNFENSRFILEI